MAIVVVNCFHWIGYHFVEMLLDSGEEVIGVHTNDSEKAAFLSMFLARNSLFTEQSRMPPKAEKVVVIGDNNNIPESPSIIQLIEEEDCKEIDTCNQIYIQMPLLYGEWMPMNEHGMYVKKKHVSYESDRFKEEAVYVQTFIKVCLTILDENKKNPKEKLSNEDKELILENKARFRDNRRRNENIEKLKMHYFQFASLYYE